MFETFVNSIHVRGMPQGFRVWKMIIIIIISFVEMSVVSYRCNTFFFTILLKDMYNE